MDTIRALLTVTARQYNTGQSHVESCRRLLLTAHEKLASQSSYEPYGNFAGRPPVAYNVFQIGGVVSRPVRPDLYIADQKIFSVHYDQFVESLSDKTAAWTNDRIHLANQVVYTAVMSFACCYDLWQRGSRKTPGTFFEILIAGLLQRMLPTATFSKHIPLAALLHDPEAAEGVTPVNLIQPEVSDEEASSVSTDLVISAPGQSGGIVVPLKITTRERIVQPFAHQRILDSAFGPGQFNSLLVCISETQLDDRTKSVKQVCVPGTVKLFQRYLAPLRGIYYCDIPQRYAMPDMQRIVPVRSIGDFFPELAELIASHSASRN